MEIPGAMLSALSCVECSWIGSSKLQLLEHYETAHPDKVGRNGMQLIHDITTSSQKNYLLYAFHTLFQVYTKICVTTGKIFHSVQFLGDPDNAANFSFTVTVKRDGYSISKSQSVAPAGCLEDTSSAISINGLLEILDGFEGTKFIVTVYDMTGCAECKAKLKKYYYLDVDGWLCKCCGPPKQPCENQDKGCTHRDMYDRRLNHEWYFCPLTTECFICMDYRINEPISEESLIAHYTSVHSYKTHASGSTWRNTIKFDNRVLIATTYGLLMCCSRAMFNFHDLFIFCPVLTEELHELSVEIKLSHPVTKQSKTYNCKARYNIGCGRDYEIKVSNNDCMSVSYNDQYDICITVSRVVN